MKICPQCRQQYEDDGLNFCLNDGSVLDFAPKSEAKTIYFEAARKTAEYGAAPQGQPPAVWQGQQQMQPQPYAAAGQYVANRDKSLAIISLLLGIFSSLIMCLVIGIPVGLGAIITGALAIRNESSDPSRFGGRGLAIVGIILGAIGMVAGFFFFLLYSV